MRWVGWEEGKKGLVAESKMKAWKGEFFKKDPNKVNLETIYKLHVYRVWANDKIGIFIRENLIFSINTSKCRGKS